MAICRLFGTDGVRGRANAELGPELALKIARAAATVLRRDALTRPIVVVGRDPRASGEMLQAAVVAGLTAAGADALIVGILPTPAVAFLTAARDADFGIMISASHNPMADNGIKIFAAGGTKLSDDVEDAIEAVLRNESWPTPTGAEIGRATTLHGAGSEYVEHLASVSQQRLNGLRVVVDCAHGAAAVVGPQALAAAGAEVIAINNQPDGLNINDGCGSTHLEPLKAAVLAHRADLGIAFDGDADRCLAVDAAGAVIDGDHIMAVLALAMRDAGTLTDNTLVATVMSNLGLHLAMRAAGISVRTTGVGDRYVLEELAAGGFSLGGEQSGHVVLPAHGTTGDGVLTALLLLARVASSGKSLAELAHVMSTVPQVLINVRVADKRAVAQADSVLSAVANAEAALGDSGRVLLRPSGTEELVRVMVEALDETLAHRTAQDLVAVVSAVG